MKITGKHGDAEKKLNTRTNDTQSSREWIAYLTAPRDHLYIILGRMVLRWGLKQEK